MADTSSVTIKIEIRYLDRVNYAVYHNGYPVCEQCALINESDSDLHDVTVSLQGAMVEPVEVHLDLVPATTTIKLDGLNIKPDASELLKITESVTTSFTIAVSHGGATVLEENHQLKLLPMEHWMGASVMPEMLAAYVTPNADVVTAVLTRAAVYLEELTGDASLDGYQSQDPNRSRAQVAAIYMALRELNIIYSNPPAGFEQRGQRLRTANQVVDQKLATCVDTSLLMASCLEGCGLNPVLVLVSGHAMVGAWLVNDHCISMASDDVAYLFKRCVEGVDEMVLVESTFVTTSNNPTFEQAVSRAIDTLRSPAVQLHCFVDVRACRLQGLKPIPLNREHVNTEGIEHGLPENEVREVKMVDMSDLATRADITRQQIWERKLLDFSMRNNLLNMKLGRRVIQFVSFGIEQLEDQLSDGRDFEVMPTYDESMQYHGSKVVDSMQFRAVAQEAVVDALSHNRVIAYLDEVSLNDNLKYIYRTSRTAMEENGSNSLFLALGVLKWYETERSTQERCAPIVMVPMQIVRHKANQYVLRARDEESIINVSLLEMIRQQFRIELPLLDPLPVDEHGVDVGRILAIVRQCVKDMPRWNVLDESVLGLFSFNKFVMWKDIRNNSERMTTHPFIAGLLANGSAELSADEPIEGIDNLDVEFGPTDLALPVDIDSSQLEAVIESDRGRSFILHGPPGTGKSQTITNIIANALYHGKRVLFVAAKMAALEVVQKRLENIGLAPFCLELHSNKSTKTHFLKQLQSALDVTRYNSPSVYASVAMQLQKHREMLNAYVDELYHVHPSGFSLYDCIEGYLGCDDDTPTIELDATMVQQLTPQVLNDYEAEVRRLDTVIQLTGPLSEHPLNGLNIDANAVTRLPECKQLIVDTVEAIRQTVDDDVQLTKMLHHGVTHNLLGVKAMKDVLQQLLAIDDLNPHLIKAAQNSSKINEFRLLIDVGRRRDATAATVCKSYDPAVLQLDPADLRSRWQKVEECWWLKRFFAKRRFVKEMRVYKSSFIAEDLSSLNTLLESYRRDDATVRQGQQTLLDYFDELAQPGFEKWDAIVGRMNDSARLLEALQGYCHSMNHPLEHVLNGLVDDASATGRLSFKHHHQQIKKSIDNCSKLTNLIEQLRQTLGVGIEEGDDLEARLTDFERWIPAVVPLGAQWHHWGVSETSLRQNGLGCIADLVINGHTGQQAADILVKSAYKALADGIVALSLNLQTFNGLIFEHKIARFRDLDSEYQQLTKKMLYCRLAANVPVGAAAAVSHGSEVGIVKRNIANNGRGNSIRSIIDQIPTLLPKLCPCMLMSPLSVAQFLSIDTAMFDLVIFDEASQLPTSEAIGSIARGKSVIVVGDPKQMPPTSFFNVSQVDEDEADIDDLDSILDDAIALSLPSRHLTWHYRSKHESLIAFSNAQYYGGRLFTFPSVDDRVSRVRFVPVEGTYDKGHTRSNPAEAEAIVNELVKRIESGERSVGVVAFSIAQQNLIEDKLLEVFERRPALESKAYDVSEPVFIKNLENVQGDERDVILFSVGYGPDSHGRVSMNFGPLNKTGGERRLNVAVSRARYEMMVFSTLMPEQIDLNRSKAQGVAGLRMFLEYARDGRLSMNVNQLQTSHTVMANAIADALTAKGYTVKTNVGRSRFKVDVAVVDSRDGDRYVLGIVCDGVEYHEAHTARDREVCRPSMLAMLGWNVVRVWAIEWYRNPDKELDRIVSLIEAELAKPSSTDETLAVSAPSETAPEVGVEITEKAAPERPSRPKARKVAPRERHENPLFKKSEMIKVQIPEDLQKPYPQVSYQPVAKPGLLSFLESGNVSLEVDQIKQIVDSEQPVTENVIFERMQQMWGIDEYENVRFLVKRVTLLLPRCRFYVDPMSMEKNRTYWKSKEDAENFGLIYREGGGRKNNGIPTIEVANAVRVCVVQEVSIPLEDLQKRITQQFSLARRSPKMNAVIDFAIDCLVKRGEVVRDGETVRVP